MRPGRRASAEREPTSGARDRWLLSYADFLTLLLALFVVLYASARLEAERHRVLFEGLQSAFAQGEPAAGDAAEGRPADAPADPDAEPPGRDRIEPPATLRLLEQRLARALERARPDRDPGIGLHATERGLVITLAAAEYFPAGGVEIPPERKRMLAAIGPLLAAQDGPLRFEGHTDDQPVADGPFPSNWELSSARAAAVARYFIEVHGIDPQRVSATGFAAHRPAVAGDGPADRARNRRVEIVVSRDDPRNEARTVTHPDRDLARLLERLPPLPERADESLRPADPGPSPPAAPLP